jgi:hypothetical protein
VTIVTTRHRLARVTYRIALGTSAEAPVVEHEVATGSLNVGDEILVEGVVWTIYGLAPFDGRAELIAVLAQPSVIMQLDHRQVELYRGELAQLRSEVRRLTDTRGEPASEALAMIEGVLERDELPQQLSDDALRVLSLALHALEVSDGLNDRLRAFWDEVRDYLERHHQPDQ